MFTKRMSCGQSISDVTLNTRIFLLLNLILHFDLWNDKSHQGNNKHGKFRPERKSERKQYAVDL